MEAEMDQDVSVEKIAIQTSRVPPRPCRSGAATCYLLLWRLVVVDWQALMEAIKAVTDMNQDLSVEKIEIQTNAERV